MATDWNTGADPWNDGRNVGRRTPMATELEKALDWYGDDWMPFLPPEDQMAGKLAWEQIIEAARRVATLDMEAATKQWYAERGQDFSPRIRVEEIVNVALGITTEDGR